MIDLNPRATMTVSPDPKRFEFTLKHICHRTTCLPGVRWLKINSNRFTHEILTILTDPETAFERNAI